MGAATKNNTWANFFTNTQWFQKDTYIIWNSFKYLMKKIVHKIFFSKVKQNSTLFFLEYIGNICKTKEGHYNLLGLYVTNCGVSKLLFTSLWITKKITRHLIHIFFAWNISKEKKINNLILNPEQNNCRIRNKNFTLQKKKILATS